MKEAFIGHLVIAELKLIRLLRYQFFAPDNYLFGIQ